MSKTKTQIEKAQKDFASVRPSVEKVAGHAFKYMNPEAKEEVVAETTAAAWKNHFHYSMKGKQLPVSSVAHYAVQNVRMGRRFAGTSSTDALSPRTKLLGRSRVSRFVEGFSVSKALMNKRTWENPLEAVRIKLDYAKFLRLPDVKEQERKVFRLIAQGHTTAEIAEKMKVTPPRICQIKNSIGRKLKAFFRW